MEEKMNLRSTALITGLSLVVMTVVAGLTMGGVFSPLFEMNKKEVSDYISEEGSVYVAGVIGWIVILICDLLVSWGLYQFYKGENKRKAGIMGGARLIYSLILFYAITHLISVITGSNTPVEMYEHVHKFQDLWQFGLIIFGIHLLFLSPFVCKKKSIRQVIGALLFIAGIGYMISNTLDLFIAGYEQLRPKVELVFILPMVLGEFGLAIWLLVKGGRTVTLKKKQYVS